MKKTIILIALSLLYVARLGAEEPMFRLRVPIAGYERDMVAACLVLEASNQSKTGMTAVMAVIQNRAKASSRSFYKVTTDRKQFSCLNGATGNPAELAKRLARAQREPTWQTALALVDAADRGLLEDPTGGAMYYVEVTVYPKWRSVYLLTAVIGHHAFYVSNG